MKQPLSSLADVPDVGAKKVDFFGREALVYRHGGEIKAARSICAHLGGPLELKDGELVFPWHSARFDAASGACRHGPSAAGSKAMFLPVRVEAGVLTYVWSE